MFVLSTVGRTPTLPQRPFFVIPILNSATSSSFVEPQTLIKNQLTLLRVTRFTLLPLFLFALLSLSFSLFPSFTSFTMTCRGKRHKASFSSSCPSPTQKAWAKRACSSQAIYSLDPIGNRFRFSFLSIYCLF